MLIQQLPDGFLRHAQAVAERARYRARQGPGAGHDIYAVQLGSAYFGLHARPEEAGRKAREQHLGWPRRQGYFAPVVQLATARIQRDGPQRQVEANRLLGHCPQREQGEKGAEQVFFHEISVG